MNEQIVFGFKKKEKKKWVLVISTGKVSDGWIRDLKFNPHLHQKLIGVLVWIKNLKKNVKTFFKKHRQRPNNLLRNPAKRKKKVIRNPLFEVIFIEKLIWRFNH